MAKKTKSSPVAKVVKARSSSTNKKKSSGGESSAMRIMKALASQRAMGIREADRTVIQGLAGIPSKLSFNTTILNMKKKQGWVEYNTKTISMTDAGVAEVGEDACTVPASNDAMQEKLKENIKQKKSREIFDILADGRSYSRAELAKKMGLEDNKSFGTYLSALSKVAERENGKMRLKDIAFPCGRPCDKA